MTDPTMRRRSGHNVVGVELVPAERHTLEEVAQAQGLSVPAAVRTAIRQFVAQHHAQEAARPGDAWLSEAQRHGVSTAELDGTAPASGGADEWLDAARKAGVDVGNLAA